MSRWFRHYAGMVRDDKLVRASLRCKQSIERVVWVWGAVLESAAELDDEGRYEVDASEIAYFLRCKPAAIKSILEALGELGRLDGEHVTAWSKRQFKSDRSNDRVANHRANKRAQRNGDETLHVTGGVTLQERDRNSPETETETETEVRLSNDNRAEPEADQVFWDGAKAFIKPESRNPGALVGKWVRDHGKLATAEAITRAQLERPVQRVPFIEGCLRKVPARQPAVPL